MDEEKSKEIMREYVDSQNCKEAKDVFEFAVQEYGLDQDNVIDLLRFSVDNGYDISGENRLSNAIMAILEQLISLDYVDILKIIKDVLNIANEEERFSEEGKKESASDVIEYIEKQEVNNKFSQVANLDATKYNDFLVTLRQVMLAYAKNLSYENINMVEEIHSDEEYNSYIEELTFNIDERLIDVRLYGEIDEETKTRIKLESVSVLHNYNLEAKEKVVSEEIKHNIPFAIIRTDNNIYVLDANVGIYINNEIDIDKLEDIYAYYDIDEDNVKELNMYNCDFIKELTEYFKNEQIIAIKYCTFLEDFKQEHATTPTKRVNFVTKNGKMLTYSDDHFIVTTNILELRKEMQVCPICGNVYDSDTDYIENSSYGYDYGDVKCTRCSWKNEVTLKDEDTKSVYNMNHTINEYKELYKKCGSITRVMDNMYIVSKEVKGKYYYGLLDRDFNVLLPIDKENVKNNYERIKAFYGDRFFAKKNGKEGLIDDKGNVVIPIEYKELRFLRVYSEVDYLKAIKENGKISVIDVNGKVIVDELPYVDMDSEVIDGQVVVYLEEAWRSEKDEQGVYDLIENREIFNPADSKFSRIDILQKNVYFVEYNDEEKTKAIITDKEEVMTINDIKWNYVHKRQDRLSGQSTDGTHYSFNIENNKIINLKESPKIDFEEFLSDELKNN